MADTALTLVAAPADPAPPAREEADGARPGPSRLSPSGASTFQQCPRRWRFKYVDRLPEPSGEAAVVGTFVHRVLEELLAAPPSGRTVERARELARLLWPEVESDDDFAELDLNADRARGFRWRAWRSIEGYFALEDPAAVDVVQREQKIEADVAGVPFVGVVDRTERGPSGLVVTDYKTGRPPSARFAPSRLGQVLLYAAALAAVGEAPARARLLYLGATSLEVDATSEAVGEATDALRRTWADINEAIDADRFAPTTGPLCAWCAFADRCPEGTLEIERRYGPAA